MPTQLSSLGRGARTLLVIVLLVVALIAANVIAGFLPLRVDITEDGLYTLSEGTERILDALENPVTIKYYFSEDVPEVPIAVKNYHRKVVELLEAYEAASGGKLVLQTYSPEPDSDEEVWAERFGLNAVPLGQGSKLYFGLVALSEDREAALPFISTRREKFLEYDVSEVITRVSHTRQPKLGVLSYLPITGRSNNPMQQPQGAWVVLEELRKLYDLEHIPSNATTLPEGLSGVILVHPRRITPGLTYALDQFLLRGGRLVALLDPNARQDPTASGPMGGLPGGGSSLEPLLEAWGITHDKDRIVGDLALATQVTSPQDGVIDFPLWITAGPQQMNPDVVVTSNLEEVVLVDTGAFGTTDGFAYTFQPLITTTKDSGDMDNMLARFAGPAELTRRLKPDGEPRVLAAVVTGRFQTAFPDGPPPEEKGEGDADTPPLPPKPHLTEGEAETTVVLIGDADFIGDPFAAQPVNFFGQQMMQPINDNLSFFLNAVEYATGNQNLIAIRSRGQFSRPFTRVLELQAEAQRKHQQEEQALTQKLERVRGQLAALEGQRRGEGNVLLTPEAVQEIQRFRQEEQRTRTALREVRRELRQDIEALGNRLLLFNLLTIPILVALVGSVIIYRRSKRKGGRR